MSSSQTSGRRRLRPTIAAGVALGTALLAAPAHAGSTTGDLPNGADLTVSVERPITGDTFVVPAGATTVDVPLSGTASIATGTPNVTWIYVVDVSGSTGAGCTAGLTVLGCEKLAVAGLNDLVTTDGSAAAVGLAVFSSSGAAADISSDAGEQALTAPADPDVDTAITSIVEGGITAFTNKSVGSGSTNYVAGLDAASAIAAQAGSGPINVVFLSDGQSNAGSNFAGSLATLAAQATIYPFAVGAGSSCTGGSVGTLAQMAAASGTECFAVPDPADLPDVIKNVTATSLTSVSVTLDGAPVTATVAPALPVAGPATVTWQASAEDLAPGSHTVCATATGVGPASDTTATQTVKRCETFSVFGFALTPPTATNELGSDDTHTVTATVSGPAGELAGWPVDFGISAGPNTGDTGTCAPADCRTDATGTVTFSYTVPKEPASLGTDTITGTVDINGDEVSLDVSKLWQDTTPPSVQCVPTTNPGGSIPGAPGNGGQGQNQDGYYRLVATDDVWPASDLDIFVKDTGSSTVFGPFAVDTDIKWVEANGSKPSQKPGNGVVEWNLKGRGDAEIHAVDGSGNTSATVLCTVPNAPQ